MQGMTPVDVGVDILKGIWCVIVGACVLTVFVGACASVISALFGWGY